MIPGFGWSASDLATACVIIGHIAKAFDSAKGANKQYRDSHAFLCSLHQVVSYIHDEEKASSLPDNAGPQVKTISDAYNDLHAYILKYARIEERENAKLKTILPTIRWAMSELNHKVQHMKTSCLNAIAVMETLIVMDLSSKMNSLIQMGSHQEQSLETASKVLSDVQHQLVQLSQVSEDYQVLLDDMNQTNNEQLIDLKAIQEHMNSLQKSQTQLQEQLSNLVRHLEQHKQDGDQARAEEWRKMLENHKYQHASNSNGDQTKEEIGRTKDLIGGAGELTNNAQLKDAGTRLQGLERVYGALGPVSGKIGKFWGSSKSQHNEAVSSASSPPPTQRREVPQVVAPPPPRQYKPAPPVITPPPPRRIPVQSPPAQTSGSGNLQTSPRIHRLPIATPAANSRIPARKVPPNNALKIPSRSTFVPYNLASQVQHQSDFDERLEQAPPLPPRPLRATSPPVPVPPAVAQRSLAAAPPLPPRPSTNGRVEAAQVVSATSNVTSVELQPMSRVSSSISSTSTRSISEENGPPTPAARRSPVFAVREIHGHDPARVTPPLTKSPPPPTSPKPIYLNELVRSLKSRQLE